MTRIRWATEAADQLEAIVKNIRQDNPEASRDVAEVLYIWHGAQHWR